MKCTTRDGLVVKPQNHPALRMAGFTEFVPQNSVVQFPWELEAAHGVIVKGASNDGTSCGACGCQIKILGVGPFCPWLSE
jgi:hypothetical protein